MLGLAFQIFRTYSQSHIDLLGATRPSSTYQGQSTGSLAVLLGVLALKVLVRILYLIKVTCHMRNMNFLEALGDCAYPIHTLTPIFVKSLH